MKRHLLNWAMLGLFVLAGTVGFTACSDDAVADNEPTENPSLNKETKEVNVNFVMNVEYGQPATTRMSAATAQIPNATSSTFRGIEEAKLLPYIVTGSPTFLSEAVATGASKVSAARKFDLSKLYTSSMANNQEVNDGTTTTNNNMTSSSRRVIELPMPLQSNLMLIYGKAIKGTTPTSSPTQNMDEVEGKIVMDIQEDASNTDISLSPRLTDGTGGTVNEVEQYQKAERLTAFILNRILHARVNAKTEQSYTFTTEHSASHLTRPTALSWDYGTGNTPGAVVWANLGATYAAYKGGTITTLGLTPLEESLAEAYYNITTVRSVSGTTAPYTPGEYRAGSMDAVARLVYDLYMICDNVYKATPTQNDEAEAMRLAARIGHQIFGFFTIDRTNQTATIRNIGSDNTDIESIRYFITNQITGDTSDPIEGITDSDFTSATGVFYGLTDGSLKDFPTCFGLPKGSAQLAWEIPSDNTIPTGSAAEIVKEGTPAAAVQQFVYHYTNQPFVTDMTTAIPSFDPTHYMYPAELAYFVNSPLRVNDTAITNNNFDALFPNGADNWNDTSKWATSDGWNTGAVTSSTNTIAVQKNINYGVAMLKTTITSSNATLPDNRPAFKTGETSQDINVSGLTLMGVLIGGQDNHVDWQYLPKDAGSATYVIYDNAVGNYSYDSTTGTGEWLGLNVPASGTTAPNYTIVFDNYDKTIASGTKQKSVRFALEFKNNGTQDFWGKDNLIRKGGTFYLQGEMIIPDDVSGIVWDNYYQVPPLNQTTGVSTQVARVFIQDHVTDAVITLGPNALKQALVSVPDLRSSQTSLGLSVDLTWSQGLTFTPTIGPATP